MIRRDILLEI